MQVAEAAVKEMLDELALKKERAKATQPRGFHSPGRGGPIRPRKRTASVYAESVAAAHQRAGHDQTPRPCDRPPDSRDRSKATMEKQLREGDGEDRGWRFRPGVRFSFPQQSR